MSPANPLVPIAPLSSLSTSARHVLTFRSWRDPSLTASILLFYFPPAPGDDAPPTLSAMESECPHLGMSLEQAPLEQELEDMDQILVCPMHQYDFSLKTGQSSTGMKACVFAVEVREGHVWVEAPGNAGDDWRLLSVRPVSERFAESSILPSPSPSPSLDLLPSTPPKTLRSFCRLILLTPNPAQKVAHTRTLVSLFRGGKLKRLTSDDDGPLPDVPPREHFNIVDGTQVAKRGKGGSVASRAKLLHALAWIELWAIDLSIDIISRFALWRVGSEDGKTGSKLPLPFFADFLKVAEDEAKHFSILKERIEQMGFTFGEFPVHNGLWESARETMHSLFSRIAIIHLVAEARGMDVNPMQIKRCRAAGDHESAQVMTTIHHDEITHVAAGHRHFLHLCSATTPPLDPIAKFRAEVQANFHGKLKGPFNVDDRDKAGLTAEWYEDLEGRKKFGPDDAAEGGGSVDKTENETGADRLVKEVEGMKV